MVTGTAGARPGPQPGVDLAALVSAERGAGAVAFLGAEADRVARLCHAMAQRFAAGGRLLALGHTPSARSDAHHVAVEFVHPVIVGKRALPALALTGTTGPLVDELASYLRREDMVMGFEAHADGGEVGGAMASGRDHGALTIGFGGAGAEWELDPGGEHAYVAQEVVETLYHVLWELVHVFFEHRGLLGGPSRVGLHDAGASSFLYPFLEDGEHNLSEVLEDVSRSALMKAQEIAALRRQTLEDNAEVVAGAAVALRECFAAGGKLLALGNGGSATDAMDVAADFSARCGGGGRGWPALDLTGDAAVLTAIANDIGPEAIFARQVIALGEAGDFVLALSTSGNSANVIEALAEARRRGLMTVAMVGYDGGRIGSEGLADHVIITRSEHIPRIQEAQASAYHALRALVG